MAYLGRTPNYGNYRKLDDISSGFNGAAKQFNLTVAGDAAPIASAYQLIVSLGGVLQEPGVAYSTSGSTITFSEAPTSGLDFYAILLGNTFDAVGVSDGSVSGSSFAPSVDLTGKTLTSATSIGADAFVGGTVTGTVITGTANSVFQGDLTVQQDLIVDGNATFNGNTTIISQTTIETEDGLLHLASNNETSDTLDVGFFAHYYDGTQNNHAGFIRDSGTKDWYLFGEYAPGAEPTTNIDIGDGSFELANVHVSTLNSSSINNTTGIGTATVTATGTVTANNYVGDGSTLSNVASTGKAIAMAIVFG